MVTGNVPIFRFVDEDGIEAGTQPLWQRQDMLVAVLDDCDVCHELARALRADEGELASHNAGLVLVPASGPDSIELIADQLFEAFAAFGVSAGTPTLGVADRFGRLYAALDVHDTDVDDLLRQARDWLDFAQEQCDECGVPLETKAETSLADSADDGPG
jgi:hypothetical protein